jgi:hypothetical protein
MSLTIKLPTLRASRRLAPLAVLLLALLSGLLGGRPAAAASPVKVEVSAGDVVGRGVTRVFGFSGNIWYTPEAFGVGLDERILSMPHPGLLRFSLGDQVLQHATSFADLQRRLDNLGLNDFLRKFHAAGGRILIGIDGMPRWASANPSTEIRKGTNLPMFRGSGPTDYALWSRIVEAAVQHFNGRLKLNAYYEAWNEPNFYYSGTNAQFMRQYTATVLGARRADPNALVGGPGVSELVGATTGGESTQTKADKLRITEQMMDHRYLMHQFLQHAARTPLPELGLARLPVDFFSWHSYYVDPTRHYELAVPYIRKALKANGYSANTPLFVTEWNIAPDLPYPEGDLNATEVGAAYAATTLIAMHEAGVDAQSYQMFVDPGVPGHYGGMFTNWGVPRASFQAFRLFSMLRGQQVRTRSSDRWVKTVAFVDGDTLYLLVASLVPSAKMLVNDDATLKNLPNADFTRSLVRDGLVEQVVRGAALPAPAALRAREIERDAEQRVKSDAARANERRRGLALEIQIGDFGQPRSATRYLVDASHANVYPQLAKAQRLLETQEKRSAVNPSRLRDALSQAGLTASEANELLATLGRGLDFDQAQRVLPAGQRARAREVLAQAVRDVVSKHRALLQEIEEWPGAGLSAEPLDWPPHGALKLDLQGNSVLLLVLRK